MLNTSRTYAKGDWKIIIVVLVVVERVTDRKCPSRSDTLGSNRNAPIPPCDGSKHNKTPSQCLIFDTVHLLLKPLGISLDHRRFLELKHVGFG